MYIYTYTYTRKHFSGHSVIFFSIIINSLFSHQEVLVLASRKEFPNSLMGLSTGWWTHASYFSPRWPTCQARGFRQSTKSCWDRASEKSVKSAYKGRVGSNGKAQASVFQQRISLLLQQVAAES